jgi:DNA-binding protein Fis
LIPFSFQDTKGSKPFTLFGHIETGSIMAKEGISEGTIPRVLEDLKADRIEDLSLEDLLEKKLTGTLNGVDTGLEFNYGLFHDVISIVERILIKMALKKTKNVQVSAAQFLGINRNTLRKKIKDLKITMP